MSIRSTILAENPHWYLPLDETSGVTAFDASGNGRHGTYTGDVLPVLNAGRGPDCDDEVNRSVGFDGEDNVDSPQRVQTEHFPPVGSNAVVSMEVWALMHPDWQGERCPYSWRRPGVSVSQDLWAIASEATREWHWRIAGSREEILDWHYASCWHHIVNVATPNERQFWVDGEQIDGREFSSTLSDEGGIAIGCDLRRTVHSSSSAPHRVWHGRLAHAVAYDYALSPRQIVDRWSQTCRRCVGWAGPGAMKRPQTGRVPHLAT